MTSAFLTTLSELLNKHEITVHRFEFPYMIERRIQGKRRPPPAIQSLLAPFEKAIEACQNKISASSRLFIGGKSMGGRVASLVAINSRLSEKISGLILLGYPFHPPAYPQKTRLSPFSNLKIPTLLVQGTRDPFGTQEEIIKYPIPPCVDFFWITDGDHDFKRPRASGQTHASTLNEAALAISDFLKTGSKAHPKIIKGKNKSPGY